MGSLSVSTSFSVATYITKNSFYRIEPSLGKVKSLCARSCKHIRESLATDCNNLPRSGLYWICCDENNPMQVCICSYMYVCECVTVVHISYSYSYNETYSYDIILCRSIAI